MNRDAQSSAQISNISNVNLKSVHIKQHLFGQFNNEKEIQEKCVLKTIYRAVVNKEETTQQTPG